MFCREVTKDTRVPRGQPEIARGHESQIERWLPSEQHTGKRLRESGSKYFALAELTKSVTGHGIRYYQCRGAPLSGKKYLAARLGEEFSLDSPFHRTAHFIELSVNARVGTSSRL